MGRRKAPAVQVLGAVGEQCLLVRAQTWDEARGLAGDWLAERKGGEPWGDSWEDGLRPVLSAGPVGWWRWIPASGHERAEFSYRLREEPGPALGAFYAWQVQVEMKVRQETSTEGADHG
jgi:hypothetical protein